MGPEEIAKQTANVLFELIRGRIAGDEDDRLPDGEITTKILRNERRVSLSQIVEWNIRLRTAQAELEQSLDMQVKDEEKTAAATAKVYTAEQNIQHHTRRLKAVIEMMQTGVVETIISETYGDFDPAQGV